MKTFKEFAAELQQEEVAANSMSAQSPSAIANPNNRMLFGKKLARRKKMKAC